jgi:hypothetical protein
MMHWTGSKGKYGRKVWEESMGGKYGRKVWEESMGGKYGKRYYVWYYVDIHNRATTQYYPDTHRAHHPDTHCKKASLYSERGFFV